MKQKYPTETTQGKRKLFWHMVSENFSPQWQGRHGRLSQLRAALTCDGSCSHYRRLEDKDWGQTRGLACLWLSKVQHQWALSANEGSAPKGSRPFQNSAVSWVSSVPHMRLWEGPCVQMVASTIHSVIFICAYFLAIVWKTACHYRIKRYGGLNCTPPKDMVTSTLWN